jgi:hypothetical protein
MRNVNTANNETLVYKVAYFSMEQIQNLSRILTGSLGGLNIIYLEIKMNKAMRMHGLFLN